MSSLSVEKDFKVKLEMPNKCLISWLADVLNWNATEANRIQFFETKNTPIGLPCLEDVSILVAPKI